MASNRIVYKDLNSIESIPTAHLVGVKRIFLSNDETSSNVTQIAVVSLSEGDCIDNHTHSTMDEHFFILKGLGEIKIENEIFDCDAGKFILVPAGCDHCLSAKTNMEILTIGIAI